MKTLAAIASATLTLTLLPIGCATPGGPEARVAERPGLRKLQPAADATIYIDGIS